MTEAENMENQGPLVLWVDDDEEDRFIFEIDAIKSRLGWQVQWAGTVREAAMVLTTRAVDALILDQMICDHGISSPIWSGCRLLHWLRGKKHPDQGPWPREELGWRLHLSEKPLACNRQVPVVLVSAYHNREVLDATMEASTQDRLIRLYSKPVDFQRIQAFLQKVDPRVTHE